MMSQPFTAAIFLGASTFPGYHFPQSPQFRATHDALRAYFTDPVTGMGVPPSQILNLFDSHLEPGRQRNAIRLFLESLVATSAAAEIRNLFVHYVGHGMIIDNAYFVALSGIAAEEETTTCLRMRDLGTTLHKYHGFRRFVILDCCYAAATAAEWMGDESAIARKASQAFQGDDPPEDEDQLPANEITQGTTLLCAANQFEEAMSPSDITYTLFGDALLDVLKVGSKNAGPLLNVNNLEGLTWARMKKKHPDKAVRPVVHSPDQPQGNIARIGIFPNHKFKVSAPSVLDLENHVLNPHVEAAQGADDNHARGVDKTRSNLSPPGIAPPHPKFESVNEQSNKEPPPSFKHEEIDPSKSNKRTGFFKKKWQAISEWRADRITLINQRTAQSVAQFQAALSSFYKWGISKLVHMNLATACIIIIMTPLMAHIISNPTFYRALLLSDEEPADPQNNEPPYPIAPPTAPKVPEASAPSIPTPSQVPDSTVPLAPAAMPNETLAKQANASAAPKATKQDSPEALPHAARRFPELKDGASVTLEGCVEHNSADSHISADVYSNSDAVLITRRGPKVKNWTPFWNACRTGAKCRVTGVVKLVKDGRDTWWDLARIDKFEYLGECLY